MNIIFFTFKTFHFYNLHYFRDFTYRSDRMATLLGMQRKFCTLACCLYDTRCSLNPVRNDLSVSLGYFCHSLDILKHKYHFTVFIHVFSMFIGQSCLSGIIGFVGYAHIGYPKQFCYKFSFSSYTCKKKSSYPFLISVILVLFYYFLLIFRLSLMINFG